MTQAQPRPTDGTTVSVLIVNWNRREYVRETLADLRTHNVPGLEVVVVDNASTDGAAEMIADEFPDVRLIRMPTNEGQCRGLNVGLEQARGDIVISLDNDAVLGQGSIDRIVEAFQERPNLAVLHGRIIDFDTREDVWWWEWYGRDQATNQDREFETPWKIAEGMCALRRRAALAVGGFPDEYFIMEAGRDLAIRLVDAGWELRYTPRVAFFHKSSADRERTDRYRLHSNRRMYYKLRNELWTVWKYYPLEQVVWKTVMKMVVWAAVMGRRGSLDCYASAMMDAYRGLPAIVRRRRRAQPQTLKKIEYSRLRAMKQFRSAISWYYVVAQRAG